MAQTPPVKDEMHAPSLRCIIQQWPVNHGLMDGWMAAYIGPLPSDCISSHLHKIAHVETHFMLYRNVLNNDRPAPEDPINNESLLLKYCGTLALVNNRESLIIISHVPHPLASQYAYFSVKLSLKTTLKGVEIFILAWKYLQIFSVRDAASLSSMC